MLFSICTSQVPQTFLKETLRHIFFVWLLLKVPCHLLFYSSIVVLLAFN
uniref:Uncharacterized protein n=1 Tax=Anguilla anguilla TaxID=7936 RepID=A0A0E9W0Y5_ANGAN